MRSSSAAQGGETYDHSRFYRCRVRRSQVFRNQDRAFRVLRRHLLDPGEMKEYPLADVAHVVCALREKFVPQGCQPLGVKLGRFLPGESCALTFGDGRVSNLEKIRIIQ